jgi:hypothetical protein
MAFEFTPTGMSRAKSILIPDFDKLVKDLKKLDPQLRKDFDKALKAAAKPLVEKARGFVPAEIRNSSGAYVWKPTPPTYSTPAWINDSEHRGRDAANRWVWKDALVKRNIKVVKSTANKVPFGYSKVATAALAVVNRSPAGAIFELAGRGSAASRARTTSKSRNQTNNVFNDMLIKKYPFIGDAQYGRILYRAASIVAPEVRKQVLAVVDQRLKAFVRG